MASTRPFESFAFNAEHLDLCFTEFLPIDTVGYSKYNTRNSFGRNKKEGLPWPHINIPNPR